MRKDADYFAEQDVELVYIAKKLSEAQAVEALLTARGVDYAVETDEYFGGFLFQRVRVGAFFYVLPATADSARQILGSKGYKPQQPPG